MIVHDEFNPTADVKYRICVMQNDACIVQQCVYDEWVSVATVKNLDDAYKYIKSRQIKQIIEV